MKFEDLDMNKVNEILKKGAIDGKKFCEEKIGVPTKDRVGVAIEGTEYGGETYNILMEHLEKRHKYSKYRKSIEMVRSGGCIITYLSNPEHEISFMLISLKYLQNILDTFKDEIYDHLYLDGIHEGAEDQIHYYGYSEEVRFPRALLEFIAISAEFYYAKKGGRLKKSFDNRVDGYFNITIEDFDGNEEDYDMRTLDLKKLSKEIDVDYNGLKRFFNYKTSAKSRYRIACKQISKLYKKHGDKFFDMLKEFLLYFKEHPIENN
jgi:hypothetical protein